MKRILILCAMLALGTAAAYAQITNASASGTVNINTAQNATVVYSGYGASYTYPVSGVPGPYGGPQAKLWLVANQVKDLSLGNGGSTPNPNESSGPGYLYFTVHGERGSKIDITTSALSSNTAVATILDWWDYTDNGTAWNFLNSGANPNLTITNAGDATLGSAPGTDGYIGVRFDATVTAIATGTTTITGTVTISNYSI